MWLIVLAALYNLVQPYADLLKKEVARRKYSSLSILHAPNLVGHPFGIVALVLLGLFALPADPYFYGFWFAMIAFASVQLTLTIWGLLETKFFGVQILGKLSFVVSSAAAILLIGERVSNQQLLALLLAVAGVALFAWPARHESRLVWDRGVVFVLISVLLSGLTTVLYKIATFHTSGYGMFLTGRFIGDLIGWSAVWLVVSFAILRRNPFAEVIHMTLERKGGALVLISAATSLLDSWLIFKLPVTTLSVLSTLTIPAGYIVGRVVYKDRFTARMWAGSACIVASVLLFIFPL